jgi:hypothetical protein
MPAPSGCSKHFEGEDFLKTLRSALLWVLPMGWGLLVGVSAGFAAQLVNQPIHQLANQPKARGLAWPCPKNHCHHWAGRALGWEAG